MSLADLARAILYFSGYYQWRFRRLLGLQNATVGHIHFAIQHPENVHIKSKVIGGVRPDSECVRIRQSGTAKISLGGDSVLRHNVSISAVGQGDIRIGERTVIGKGNTIETYGKAGVSIGSGCRIGWNCLFLSSDEHVVQVDGEDLKYEEDIVIGNNIWIGTRVIVLKGTEIGDNCVVAAGTICTGKYPANSLIAGSPGKVIKTNVNWRNLEKWERGWVEVLNYIFD